MKFARLLASYLAVSLLVVSAGFASAATTYFHNDLAGSPVAATDVAGQVLWRESYRPYGERLKLEPASVKNNIWFTGMHEDAHTELVYMGARYYDPRIGRFLSTDPLLADGSNVHLMNRYSYANNNPLRYSDPDGNLPVLLLLVPLVKGAAAWGSFGFLATVTADAASQFAASGQIDIQGAANEGLNAAPAWAIGGAMGQAITSARGAGALASEGVGALTIHGAERVAGAAATRGGVLTESGIVAVRHSGRTLTQADGATVRVLEHSPGRFNVVVEGEKGLITTFENLSQKSMDKLGNRYGWKE